MLYNANQSVMHSVLLTVRVRQRCVSPFRSILPIFFFCEPRCMGASHYCLLQIDKMQCLLPYPFIFTHIALGCKGKLS